MADGRHAPDGSRSRAELRRDRRVAPAEIEAGKRPALLDAGRPRALAILGRGDARKERAGGADRLARLHHAVHRERLAVGAEVGRTCTRHIVDEGLGLEVLAGQRLRGGGGEPWSVVGRV